MGFQAQVRTVSSSSGSASGEGEAAGGDEELPWRDVAMGPPGSALLLFGWTSQLRSHGKLHAIHHRVVDRTRVVVSPAAGTACGHRGGAASARRTSAVFFIAPRALGTIKGRKALYKRMQQQQQQQQQAAQGRSIECIGTYSCIMCVLRVGS